MLSTIFFLFFLQTAMQNVSGQKMNFTVPKNYYNNIFLCYYAGPTFKDQITLKLEDGLNLTTLRDFVVTNQTIFHYPGWGENCTSGSSKALAEAFLKAKIRNFVVFDYSKLIKSDNNNPVKYIISVYNATYIGQAIGQFFKYYIPKLQPLKLIRMTSHSLGSQIMAHAARTYGIGKIPHLTALDPAGPLYNIPGIRHLDATDGEFVDVIHTDGGVLGDGRTLGTVDFFVNNGTYDQPGCNSSQFLNPIGTLIARNSCSHARSYLCYAESILRQEAFKAELCDRTQTFSYCCCNSKKIVYMGYNVNLGAHGTYYLRTNSSSPYGEGPRGIINL